MVPHSLKLDKQVIQKQTHPLALKLKQVFKFESFYVLSGLDFNYTVKSTDSL